jgi:ABC-type maltose transport system permease subunit
MCSTWHPTSITTLAYRRKYAYFPASPIGAAPLIALFLLAQRYLVGGISLSGMKT